ncbi:MAG: type IV pilus assembly protein FimV [Methylomicrobium sp.]
MGNKIAHVMRSVLITVNNHDFEESRTLEFVYDKSTAGFCEWPALSVDKRLERLAFRVSRMPKSLRAHLERIYYCFNNYLNEQLFAALVDLLIILNKSGHKLSERMIFGSRSRLTDSQFQALSHFLKNEGAAVESLPYNRFSLFTKGVRSCSMLVQVVEGARETEHDPLQLARDYVEFSQLDEAVRILEQAILVRPERPELHTELLSLYRSTLDRAGFKRIYQKLVGQGANLPPEWAQLHDFLKV